MAAQLDVLVAMQALLSGVGVLAFGWWLGLHLTRRDAETLRWATAGSVVAAAGLTAASEALTPALAGWLPYASHFEFHLPAGLFAFGLAAASGMVNQKHLRRPTLFAAGLFTLWATIAFAGPLLVRLPQWGFSRDAGAPPESQSTWWCCGATATAHLLHARGAPISEREAAILVGTRPLVGTSLTGLSSGLRRAGVPNRVVRFASPDEVVRAPKPCLAITRVFGRVLHVVTVTDADERVVRLVDPMIGERDLSREEFDREWVRCLVVPSRLSESREHRRPDGPPKV